MKERKREDQRQIVISSSCGANIYLGKRFFKSVTRVLCSSVLCLVTTKIWSNEHESPQRVTALGSWTNRVIALRQISVTALFYLEDSRRVREREKKRKREREKSAHTWERESERKRFGFSFYMFFLPPGPALCKLGLARSAVCSA